MNDAQPESQSHHRGKKTSSIKNEKTFVRASICLSNEHTLSARCIAGGTQGLETTGALAYQHLGVYSNGVTAKQKYTHHTKASGEIQEI